MRNSSSYSSASIYELIYRDMSYCINENFTSEPLSAEFIVNIIRSAIVLSL